MKLRHPKIVQFKTGKYAVRRRSLPFFTFEYLDSDSCSGSCGRYWWSYQYIRNTFLDTFDDAKANLEKFVNYRKDYGVIVK